MGVQSSSTAGGMDYDTAERSSLAAQEERASANEAEGAVLALLSRAPNLSRYEIVQMFERSPAKFQNANKGSVYPLISRLEERRLIEKTGMRSSRGAPLYGLTTLGQEALRNWLNRLSADQLLPLDPLKLRAIFLASLDFHDRVAWIASAKELIAEKKMELESCESSLSNDAYGAIIRAVDRADLDAKGAWLDKMLVEIARDMAETTAADRAGGVR